eukprot:10017861-Alexandrium_andersonii.AAC.1
MAVSIAGSASPDGMLYIAFWCGEPVLDYAGSVGCVESSEEGAGSSQSEHESGLLRGRREAIDSGVTRVRRLR